MLQNSKLIGMRKFVFVFIIALLLGLISCQASYRTSERRKGKQCDCPKETKVKQRKANRYK